MAAQVCVYTENHQFIFQLRKLVLKYIRKNKTSRIAKKLLGKHIVYISVPFDFSEKKAPKLLLKFLFSFSMPLKYRKGKEYREFFS